MKNLSLLFTLFVSLFLICCTEDKQPAPESTTGTSGNANTKMDTAVQATPAAPVNDTGTVWTRKEVPVLCYHHIRDFKPNERASMKAYIVPVQTFKDQMKALADSGYHTILPDQYYAYLTTGAPLPSRPVMITFDDTDEEQFSIGAAEMRKYGFKGVYFIMTISIGRPNYMSREQLKQLSDDGHVIAAHTWDHHRVTQYTEADWNKQLTESSKTLESITGKPVQYFAYPFGLWNQAAIPELKKRGIKAAFQLYGKRDPQDPLYTLRRMLVPGTWNPANMFKWMHFNFPR